MLDYFSKKKKNEISTSPWTSEYKWTEHRFRIPGSARCYLRDLVRRLSGCPFSHPMVLQARGNFWSLVRIRREGRNKPDGEGKQHDGENMPTF